MTPFQCIFRDGAFRPLERFHNVIAAEFGEDEVATLIRQEPESLKTRNHYFVCVHEAWANLPDHLAERFPSEDHLRKYALIRAGYRDERSIVCASKAEAARVAAFIKPMDEYAVVRVSEAVVTVWTAKTQKKGAMGAEVFQASKEAVLGVLAEMIGTDPTMLRQRAKEAA